jgi:hypothetical protein
MCQKPIHESDSREVTIGAFSSTSYGDSMKTQLSRVVREYVLCR